MKLNTRLKEMISLLRDEGINNKKVLDAIMNVDRKMFVPPIYLNQAYENHPIDIGYGATISQPYTVAFMFEKLQLKKGLKVLEVGTGSGYNIALIENIVKTEVYTTEIVPELAELAKGNLRAAHAEKVKVIQTKSLGYKKGAPYDRIIVTAAANEIPKELINQLKNGGILLVPVGEHTQRLLRIKKIDKKIKEEDLGEFIFVPLRA